MKNQKNHMWERLSSMDLRFVTRILYGAFLIVVLILTILICLNAPVQSHFKELRKNDVWFGEGWYYTDSMDETGKPQQVDSQPKRYLRLHTQDGHASLSKTLDFTPLPEDYLCFRARALDTTVYVNGRVWYEKCFRTEYRSYSRRMYMLHQIPVDGLRKGDTITISLYHETGSDSSTVQFVAVGDRYALVRYILGCSRNSLLVCAAALILILLSLIASHSAILVDKQQDVQSLRCLTAFLALAILYIGTDSGCMELFVDRISIISWLSNLSLVLLPIPFMLFVGHAFFPGHKRYEALAFVSFVVAVVSVASFAVFARNISDFYPLVHLIIGADIVFCVISLVQERMVLALEAVLGFIAVSSSTVASIVFYWYEIIYPCSIIFGYGILFFGSCMLVWIVRNRNELKRMREEADYVLMERDKAAAQQASEQKSRFLSHMSHEIRTPLNAILGLNELIMHETDKSSIKKYTADIQSAGRTLLALINDILDFSKIETGKMDIAASDYSLSALLNDVVVMIQERIDREGLTLRLDIDSALPDILYGDEVRIKQVILNLLTNAVKYTKEGWVELRVRKQEFSESLDSSDILLDIRVSDSGVGIKEEDLSRLFVEFERLDRLKNRSVEGTGLGLSIASRLVRLMEGRISVESEYGKGSSFSVHIPQKVVSEELIGDYTKRFELLGSQESQEAQQGLDAMRFPGKKVFVVDDNEMNLEVIASILEMLDIEVARAGDGQEAIARLDQEAYDLILTDDMMPEITGTELMQYLHRNEESISHSTPIVVLTANAIAGAREEYMKKGFDDFMTKPIDVDVLQKILMKYLK
ncbi:MAG: response regulator [Lachnospiraceae bacterium]|nr:response regulator [Lachnospiraceae bacterium]